MLGNCILKNMWLAIYTISNWEPINRESGMSKVKFKWLINTMKENEFVSKYKL